MTRPEPGASATAARLAQLGFEPVLAPCLSIEPRPAKFPEQPAAIVITSGQAIPALPDSFHHIPSFCVGDATAARMREAGFTSVESAAGDARDLYALIVARRVPGVHLLAVGERHGVALARQLREAGVMVNRRTVYSARPLPALPPAVLEALGASEIDHALFYSAESARAFIGLKPPGTGRVVAHALSPAIGRTLADAAAQATDGLPWREIRVALAPTEADLMANLT